MGQHPAKRKRSDPICFSPYLYRARNRVERFFNRIKQCRRVATRYDKLAANYLAFVQLASIRLWLCVNESWPPSPVALRVCENRPRHHANHVKDRHRPRSCVMDTYKGK
jgi:hypothetical protein